MTDRIPELINLADAAGNDWPPVRRPGDVRRAADRRARQRVVGSVTAAGAVVALIVTGALAWAGGGSSRVDPARRILQDRGCQPAPVSSTPKQMNVPDASAVAPAQLLAPADFGSGWSAPRIPVDFAVRGTLFTAGVSPVGASARTLLQRGGPPEWQINQATLRYSSHPQALAVFDGLGRQAICQVQGPSDADAPSPPQSPVLIRRNYPGDGSLLVIAGRPVPLGGVQTVWTVLGITDKTVTQVVAEANVPLDGRHGPIVTATHASTLAGDVWARLTHGTATAVSLPTLVVPTPPAAAMLQPQDLGSVWRTQLASVTMFSGFITTLPIEPTQPKRLCPGGPELAVQAARGQTYTGPLPGSGRATTLSEDILYLDSGQTASYQRAVGIVVQHHCSDIRSHTTEQISGKTVDIITFATPSRNHTNYDEAFALDGNTLIKFAVHTTHDTDPSWVASVLRLAVQRFNNAH
jgi:hypothetical protein